MIKKKINQGTFCFITEQGYLYFTFFQYDKIWGLWWCIKLFYRALISVYILTHLIVFIALSIVLICIISNNLFLIQRGGVFNISLTERITDWILTCVVESENQWKVEEFWLIYCYFNIYQNSIKVNKCLIFKKKSGTVFVANFKENNSFICLGVIQLFYQIYFFSLFVREL